MTVPLVSESALEAVEAEVRRLIPTLDPPLAADPDDATYGAPLRHYLLFAHWLALLTRHGHTLDPAAVVYNAYYWFLTFKRLWQARHGFDAGLEQQAFQLLERAVGEIDLEAVAAIERRVEVERR